jgi:hypothetical protein
MHKRVMKSTTTAFFCRFSRHRLGSACCLQCRNHIDWSLLVVEHTTIHKNIMLELRQYCIGIGILHSFFDRIT